MDIVTESKDIKEFLNCVRYPEQRKQYVINKVSDLFKGNNLPKDFLSAVSYGVQLKTGIDLDCSPQCILYVDEKVAAIF